MFSDAVGNCLSVVFDASVKSVILAVVTFSLVRIGRIRHPEILHTIWTGVLSGMLILPLVVSTLPRFPLQVSRTSLLWPLARRSRDEDSRSSYVYSSKEPQPTAFRSPGPSVSLDVQSSPSFDRLADSKSRETGTVEVFPFETNPASNTPSWVSTNNHGSVQRSTIQTASVPNQSPKLFPVVFVTFWLAGASMMFLRLWLGACAVARIAARAVEVDMPLASELGPAVRESSDVLVPVTIGLIQPCIILPLQWRTWSMEKLSAVIVHEATHIERRDVLVTILAELNRCLYWVHPLAWWLRNRISYLAEEVCDEAVVRATGDPAAYARYLLDLPKQLRTPALDLPVPRYQWLNNPISNVVFTRFLIRVAYRDRR